jgi:hypothetical protein
MKTVLIFIVFSLICSTCNEGRIRLLGKVAIPNINSIYFNVYQKDEFESSVPIYYEIKNHDNQILWHQTWLIGTADFDQDDTRQFKAGGYDSIIYLTYIDSNTIHAIHDVRDLIQRNLPQDSEGAIVVQAEEEQSNEEKAVLFKRITKYNPSLKLY